jgi:hypothetical protein
VDEDQKTTATDAGDGGKVEATTGTPTADDRNADESVEQELARLREERKNLLPGLQEKASKYNEVERRAEEAEARLREREESPTATAQGADPQMRELQERIARAEQNAAAGDDAAFVSLVVLRDQLAQRKEMADERYLSRLRDDEYAKRLEKFYAANKAHFNSIAAADDALVGRDARENRAKLAREKAELAAKEAEVEADNRRKEAGTVSTHERGVTAGEVRARKPRMTESAFNAKIKTYEDNEREGDAHKLRADRLYGRLIVEG